MMRIRYRQLRALIAEAHNYEEIVLSDGSMTEFGSDEHVRDMQVVLAGLENLKKQHRYGSASRAKFADASAHLKRMINKATRRSEKVHIQQPKTFSQLETEEIDAD